jgi:uncharacterized membrane protein YdbT with pleckstrin-like domain
MAALVQNLQDIEFDANPHEQVIYEFKPSFLRSIIGTLGGLILILLIAITIPLLVGFIIGAIALPAWYLNNKLTNYTLTNQRVRIKKGILVRHEDDVELYRIKDVKSSVSLLNRFAGIGSVTIITSERSTVGAIQHVFQFANIDNPTQFRELLRQATEEARRARGGRELDVSSY